MNYWALWATLVCLSIVVECHFYKVKRPPVSPMIFMTGVCFQNLFPRLFEVGRSPHSKYHIAMFLTLLFNCTWRLIKFDLENL